MTDDAQPQGERTMDKATTGLYGKFNVTRTDGTSEPGHKHHGCQYFVLDADHDPHAAAALEAYAQSCEREYPVLSRDLRELAKHNRMVIAGQAIGRALDS